MSKKPIDVCSFCCNWRSEHGNSSPATIADSYPEMNTVVLKEKFYFNKKAAEEFIEDACYGNWDRLHLTGAEKHLDAEAWARMLLGEVWYCSDRWSWDRLIRTQWLYQCLLVALIKEDA